MPDAGRVVTGIAGGLRLEAPGPGTRPLSDKVKQALFSMVEAEREDVWERPMLDLFAGSGAAGIEALSRGAPAAVLVEKDPRAAAVIGRNLERTRLAPEATVVRQDALAWLARPPAAPAPFGCVVLDPPYAQAADMLAVLGRLGEPEAGWLDAAAVVVAKHFWRDTPPGRCGRLVRRRDRRFGETALSVYRREPEHEVGGC
ncbi:MAG: RsmD family RNA methyltransferase [Candidatus Limnocylindrales bacterium]